MCKILSPFWVEMSKIFDLGDGYIPEQDRWPTNPSRQSMLSFSYKRWAYSDIFLHCRTIIYFHTASGTSDRVVGLRVHLWQFISLTKQYSFQACYVFLSHEDRSFRIPLQCSTYHCKPIAKVTYFNLKCWWRHLTCQCPSTVSSWNMMGALKVAGILRSPQAGHPQCLWNLFTMYVAY